MTPATRTNGGDPITTTTAVPWLTVAEVARRLQLTPETVYGLVHRGDLPARRIGRQFRIDPDRLAEWLAREEND